ncbi:hypothetical protein HKX42_01645 [Salinisphaera sp. USBA-960]|uniref:SRPBCC family protein n=1 Tax=Salinisphaera orenii TaxID=856731 RepID=UPI000DBE5124|nr:hypothetical protein [Salifodinibacter halophilus]NNC25579.1 hypothetical protein [Salifodinibacter halophilus]
MFDAQLGGSDSLGSPFDDSEFTALFQELNQAEQPPSRIYTDARWLERERTSIFHNAWHFSCLGTDIEVDMETSRQTVALAPEDRDSGFTFNPAAYGIRLEGTHFSIVLPGFFIVMAQDCMWWIQKTTISATEVEVDVSYCFPTETIKRTDFADVLARYMKRLDQVIKEDDDIVEYQQKGLNAHVSGRYTSHEAMVHSLVRRYVEIALRGDYPQYSGTHAS